MFRVILFIIFVFNTSPLSATVKPTLESLVNSSDVILIAAITQVQEIKTGSQLISVIPTEVIKGKLDKPNETFSFKYTPRGKGKINFPTLWETKAFKLFFLKRVIDKQTQYETLILSDAWFGVDEPTNSRVAEIKKLLKK